MKLIFLILLAGTLEAGTLPNNDYKVGTGSSTSLKGFTFDTGDGVGNPSLKVNDSKSLLYSSNIFQLGDATSGNDKTFTFDATSGAALKWEGADNYVELRNNNFRFGKDTNTDIKLEFAKGGSNPALRYNSSTSKLQFSNDGTLFKDIGSGGAASGGINELDNPGFEDGYNVNWSNTGGTFSQLTGANAAYEEKSARLVASGSGQYFQSAATTFSPIVIDGVGCMADFYYKSGDNFDVKIYDSTLTLVADESITEDATVWTKFPTIVFPCDDQMYIRFESTAAGTIDVDQVYLGGNKGLSEVSQARVAGEAHFVGTTSCNWTRTSTTIGAFGTAAACPGPTISYQGVGQWQTTDANLPEVTINNLPAGVYKATFIAAARVGSGNDLSLAINDGTTTCYGTMGHDSASRQSQVVSCVFTYTSQGNRSFELYAASTSAASVIIDNSMTAVTGGGGTKFLLEYFPLESQIAFTPEQAEFFIDASIGGASPTTGSSATPQGIYNSAWDMVLNRGTARIPCSSTNPSTGLTCAAGNEAMGINFVAPVTGWYKVCSSFTSNSSTGGATFRLVTTGNADQTIITQGKAIVSHSGTSNFPHRLCDYFSLAAGERTVKIFMENSGNTQIEADRSITQYDRDINITVELVRHNVSTPILVGDGIRSPTAINPVIYSARRAGTGTVSNEIGDMINGNCTNAQPSVCTFTSGIWASAPNCVCSVNSGSSQMCTVESTTTSSFSINIHSDAGGANNNVSGVNIICHGVK